MRTTRWITAGLTALAVFAAPIATATAVTPAEDAPSASSPAPTAATTQFVEKAYTVADAFMAANGSAPWLMTTPGGVVTYTDLTGSRMVMGTGKERMESVCRPPAADGSTTCYQRNGNAKKWLKNTSTVTWDGKSGRDGALYMYPGLLAAAVQEAGDSAVVTETPGTVTVTGTLPATEKNNPFSFTITVASTPSSFVVTVSSTDLVTGEKEDDSMINVQVTKKQKIKFPSKKQITTSMADSGMLG